MVCTLPHSIFAVANTGCRASNAALDPGHNFCCNKHWTWSIQCSSLFNICCRSGDSVILAIILTGHGASNAHLCSTSIALLGAVQCIFIQHPLMLWRQCDPGHDFCCNASSFNICSSSGGSAILAVIFTSMHLRSTSTAALFASLLSSSFPSVHICVDNPPLVPTFCLAMPG